VKKRARRFTAGAAIFLLPAAAGAWSGETWGNRTRDEIVDRADEMIAPVWSPHRGIYNYRSSSGYTTYNSFTPYTGVAYSQNNPQENLSEFTPLVQNVEFDAGSTVRTTTSLNMRSGPGTGYAVVTTLAADTNGTVIADAENGTWANNCHWWHVQFGSDNGWCSGGSATNDYLVRYDTGFGNDCSGFVSICWKLGSRYTTVTFESDAVAAGGYVDSLGAVGACQAANLIIGDACDDSANHIILFNRTLDGGQMESMEQTPPTARRRSWYWSSLSTYRPIRRRQLVAPLPARINFQPSGATPPEGFDKDSGGARAAQGEWGW
jgi:hypothetical protein